MQIDIDNIAFKELRSIYGSEAKFKPGQLEAIKAVIDYSRVLVVQKTGWGKSLIYFMAAKLLKQISEIKGITVVVSPLLSLIDNQIEPASKFGLRATKIDNRLSTKDKSNVISNIINNNIDILFITPETLNNLYKQNILQGVVINLLVIDEAHCISVWGHDFRPNYLIFAKILGNFASNAHIIATTATANHQVIEDLKQQIGGDIHILTGDLERKTLYQDVIKFDNDQSKLAWLLEHLKDFSGQGIIYCQTTSEVDALAEFLTYFDESVLPYHARQSGDVSDNNLKSFVNGDTRILISTSKLGMGFDKSNIAFIILFNRPKNIIEYYQQIGRAGRSLSEENPNSFAYTLILSSPEDEDTHQYFINSVFPTQKEAQVIFDYLYQNGTVQEIQLKQDINMSSFAIGTTLKYLELNRIISQNNKTYRCTGQPFFYDAKNIEFIKQLRQKECDCMIEMQNTERCLTEFTLENLDFKVNVPCNHCANCLPKARVDRTISEEVQKKNRKYWYEDKPLEGIDGITPRLKYPDQKFIPTSLRINKLWTLCYYNMFGLGQEVAKDKYNAEQFSDYVTQCVIKFLEIKNIQNFNAITFIPSIKRKHVKILAQKIAEHFNLMLLDCFIKNDNQSEQKTMQNSFWQCKNILSTYQYNARYSSLKGGHIILLDDIYDSGWTITLCGSALKARGCDEVQPLTVAYIHR